MYRHAFLLYRQSSLYYYILYILLNEAIALKTHERNTKELKIFKMFADLGPYLTAKHHAAAHSPHPTSLAQKDRGENRKSKSKKTLDQYKDSLISKGKKKMKEKNHKTSDAKAITHQLSQVNQCPASL